MSILKQINQEVRDFQTKQIQIVPGLTFNHPTMIETIFFYYNSKFKTGEIDDEGDRKYFYNIVKNPCKVFTKAIDFDTKNIRMLTVGGGDSLKTWFMERDMKYWMRDQQFGKVLNRLFKELPIFGSVVLKIVDGTPYFVDLRNFVVMQSADDLESSNFIIEVHNYSVPEFRRVAKQMKWDESKVKDTIDMFRQMKGISHIRIYERYGEVEETNPDGKSDYIYKRVFLADVGVDEYDNYGQMTLQHPGVELSSEEWEGNPYWEFHAEKMPGRWLGIGVVETLLEPQIRQNEIANLQSKSSYWAATRLFFSTDSTMAGNLKTEKSNGDVITGEAPITQIDMADRNLAFFSQETMKWMDNRSELTFSYDGVQGERAPASTPLGETRINVAQTLSYFEGIQENVAMDVKEMIYTVIIPQFEKERSAEHTIRLIGQDLDQYIAMVKNELVFEEIIRLMTEGKTVSNQDKEVIGLAVEESIKQDKEKILTVPRNHYKGVKYDIDIDITGESIDTRVRAATKFAILQAITADPTMLQDPTKKKLLASYMEDGGINPNDIFGVESSKPDEIAQQGRAGGGVSAPQMQQAVRGPVGMTA